MEHNHPQYGRIVIRRRKNTKKLIVKYRPFYAIECSIPQYVSYGKAIKFVEKNAEWITVQKKYYVAKFEEFIHYKKILMVKNSIQFVTNAQQFNLIQDFNKNIFLFYIPKFNPAENSELYFNFLKILESIIKQEAKLYLPQRILEIAEVFGFKFNQLRIKNIRTRWGSCSYNNNINLNAHLVRLPKKLIDYVIIHELVHTVHKNHGKEFWKMLDDKLDGKAKFLDKELRQYSTSVFF